MNTNTSPISIETTIEFINQAIPKFEILNLQFVSTYTDESYDWTELYIYDEITRENLVFFIPHIRMREWMKANSERAKEYHMDLIIQDILFDTESLANDSDLTDTQIDFLLEEEFETPCPFTCDWSYDPSMTNLVYYIDDDCQF